MDKLILFMVQKNSKEVINFIEKNNKIIDYKAIINLFVTMALNNHIDDRLLFMFICYIFSKILNDDVNLPLLLEITEHYNKVPNNLQSIDLLRAYNLKFRLHNILNGGFKLIKMINGSIKRKLKNINNINDMYKLLVGFLNNYIGSFVDKQFAIVTNQTNKEILPTRITEEIHTQEIIDRLQIIVKQFGLKFLSISRIQILDQDEFNNLDYLNKITYYTNCITGIHNIIGSYIERYNEYIIITNKLDGIVLDI